MAGKNNTVFRRLEGKVAIVTGGASGIGASAATLFRDHGAKVLIADIQDDLGRALADHLGRNVTYFHCDVTDEDQVRAVVDAAVSRHGRLDIMYSNAGVLPALVPLGSFLDTAAFVRTISVNLVGAALAAKHAARTMVPAGRGCILFTASACTEIAGIAEHGYAASKHGIVGLTKSLAAELGAHGIRVNCVSPFGVLTGFTARYKVLFESAMSEVGPLRGKILRVDDVANAALYLCSDEASCVSGVNLVVDGGFSIVNPNLNKLITLHIFLFTLLGILMFLCAVRVLFVVL